MLREHSSPTDEVLLTTEELLQYLQVNLRTVYRLIKAGKIPATRVGRQWRFRKRDLDAWLDRQRCGVAPPEPGGTGTSPPRQGPPRVLVVDDEESVRELLSKTLALAAYQVDTVAGGAAALERLRNASDGYDLMFADLMMPDMDGLTLIQQVKRLRSDLPIIIITGFSTESSAIEAVNLGVAGYLTKPFRVPQVLAAAAKVLGPPAA